MPGESASDSSRVLSPNQNYRINIFRRIYDVTQLTMNERFEKN